MSKESRRRREQFDRLRNFVIYQGEDKYRLGDVLPFPIRTYSVKQEDEALESELKALLELGPCTSMEALRKEAQISERMGAIALEGCRRQVARSWWRRVYVEWRGQRYYPFALEVF